MGISGRLGAAAGGPMAMGLRYAILALDELVENKKTFYMRMFLWKGHILEL